ncbi:MAG: chemotaxis protein CheD [Rhodocyclaceae bacterium]|nr:chemotaxis protein CheD [Rhodocyclaceae bacterium]
MPRHRLPGDGTPGRGKAVRRHNPLNNGLPRRVLHPGEYYCSRGPMVLSTLLGSCVSVCLYDERAGAMGMNHFLLAERRHDRTPLLSSEAGRYGIHAMELLVNRLLALGAQRRSLRAKAFGGANVLGVHASATEPAYRIGEVNVGFVREFLARDGIPLVAEDLGGSCARQVHFTSPDYAVYLRRIRSQVDQVAAEEQRYLDRSLIERDRRGSKAPIDYW